MNSFIICLHISRLDNLLQMLRILQRREPEVVKSSEFLLSCEGYLSEDCFSGFKCGQLKLLLREEENIDHNRAKQINLGVAASQGDKLVFLDSDRVLPAGYFAEQLSFVTEEIVTAKYLYQMDRPLADEEVGEVLTGADFRSEANEMFKKNMFSGNTMLTRRVFEKLGGMDEKFFGYGFQDSDATQNAVSKGVCLRFLEVNEIHLYHPRGIYVNGQLIASGQIKLYTCINGLRYTRKWGLPVPERLKSCIIDVLSHESNYEALPFFQQFKAAVSLISL